MGHYRDDYCMEKASHVIRVDVSCWRDGARMIVTTTDKVVIELRVTL